MLTACCSLTVFWGAAISTTKTQEYGNPEALAALFSGWAFIAMFLAGIITQEKKHISITLEG